MNFEEFEVHRDKKDIQMGLQGFRRGSLHPQDTCFQCQNRRWLLYTTDADHDIPRMGLYKHSLTKIAHK